jgi:DNA-binding NarL/FixJ family response regulator
VSVRVFVIAAVRVYEQGLRQALAADPRFDVRGTGASATEGLMAIREVTPPPDIVLLDCAVPEGRDGARLLRAALPSVRLVALGLREEPEDVVAWVEAGASGLVSSDASLDELSNTLLGVARGEAPCSPRVAAALLRRVCAAAHESGEPPRNGRSPATAPVDLTAREREIVWLLNHGLSNKEIAGQLQIELGTVKNHVHNLLRKLGVSRRAEAAALLRRDAGIAAKAHSPAPRI